MDVGPVTAAITGMAGYTLAEQLLDGRDEGPAPRKREIEERDIGSFQTTGERGGIVRLRKRDLLQFYARSPKCVRYLSL